jgi:hypothetical protein
MSTPTRKFMIVTTDGKSFDPETEGQMAEDHQLTINLTELLQQATRTVAVTPMTIAGAITKNKAAVAKLFASHSSRTAKYRGKKAGAPTS